MHVARHKEVGIMRSQIWSVIQRHARRIPVVFSQSGVCPMELFFIQVRILSIAWKLFKNYCIYYFAVLYERMTNFNFVSRK